MTKQKVAQYILHLMIKNPDFFISPRGKCNYSYYILIEFGKYCNRKTVKRALKYLVECGFIIKLENLETMGYTNPCSRYKLAI